MQKTHNIAAVVIRMIFTCECNGFNAECKTGSEKSEKQVNVVSYLLHKFRAAVFPCSSGRNI